MTYFHFSSGSSIFFESPDPIVVSSPTPRKAFRKIITAPTQIEVHSMAVRYQWCLDHVKQFTCWYEGYYDPYLNRTMINFWVFALPDSEESIMFKLRWTE